MKHKLIYLALALSLIGNVLLVKKHVCYFHGETLKNLWAKHITILSPQYKADRTLIEPYFDDAFYRAHYENDLQKTGLSPIDHFMQRGWKGEWQQHCDPNAWFNVTLYKERLWPCKGNPFVDFLQQPASTVAADAKIAEIFVKDETEVYRAWIAADAFLRKNKYNIHVILPAIHFKTIPTCFKPMIARGLKVTLKDGDVPSFYKSPFLKDPESFDIRVSYEKQTFQPMTHALKNKTYQYIMHAFYGYHHYAEQGRIEPLMLNYANYTDEPLWSFPFAETEADYKSYIKRVAPGYDLVFIGIAAGTPNERIVPGFMSTFMSDEEVKEVSPEKTFSVSVLLSLGFKGNQSYSADKRYNYYMRHILWSKQENIQIPREFYVSKSGIDKFSAEYQARVMPTHSKKWILNSQFNIAIENCNQPNYFTEKIISCFTSMVIPIYIGCPNITDYFDARGMLIARDIDDVIRICNSLTPETYAKMLPYLIENKKRAETLLGLKDRFIDEFYETHVK
jgi:hypothetical protein